MYQIKNKFKLSDSYIKDLYADAISQVLWNVETSKFKGDSKLSTYLYRILYNKSIDHLRHLSTNKNEAYLQLEEDSVPASSQSDLRILETKMDVENVKKELQEIGSPCNAVIMDWAYWGYSMKEIAERNGLDNADKAKKKKYSCLQKLRAILASKGMN